MNLQKKHWKRDTENVNGVRAKVPLNCRPRIEMGLLASFTHKVILTCFLAE